MRVRNGLVSLALFVALAGLTPSTVTAYDDESAIRYDRCMTRAVNALHDCLDHAVATEGLCWSRYGYAKLWCTLRYAADSIFG